MGKKKTREELMDDFLNRKFEMQRIYKITGEILNVKIIKADENKWYYNLVNKTIRVIQTDFNYYKAIDFQDEKRPYLKFVIEKEDLEL